VNQVFRYITRYLDKWTEYLDIWARYLDKWIKCLDRKRQTSHELYGETHVTDEREEKAQEIKKMTWVFIYISHVFR
jgi:hypothetical protein